MTLVREMGGWREKDLICAWKRWVKVSYEQNKQYPHFFKFNNEDANDAGIFYLISGFNTKLNNEKPTKYWLQRLE